MKDKKIYITSMHRYGEEEGHSYLLYAGYSLDEAKHFGEQEKIDRGNKYEYEVTEFIPGKTESKKIVRRRTE